MNVFIECIKFCLIFQSLWMHVYCNKEFDDYYFGGETLFSNGYDYGYGNDYRYSDYIPHGHQVYTDYENNYEFNRFIPRETTTTTEEPKRIFFPGEYVPEPNIHHIDYTCGIIYRLPIYQRFFSNSTTVPIYRLNDTAIKLKIQGFDIRVNSMQGDAIENMTYCKDSICDSIAFAASTAVAPAGGEPAEPERSQYMAQLGERKGNKIIFLCDGVVINRRWVLSAAHCFMSPSYDLNIVRLGDYDGSRLVKDPNAKYELLTVDYPITDVIFFPDYHPKIRYHDLALISLPQKTPDFASSIAPICLPWDYVNEDFKGKEVVLTGWGATAYGGKRTNVLQQVKLRVQHPSVCQNSYSKLFGFRKKHPDGLTFENTLCVGADEEGKDACDGDSGGPVVLGYGQCRGRERFILIGIVSGGFGCGLKKYPGLYIPIAKTKYLQWIKEVAFKDYES